MSMEEEVVTGRDAIRQLLKARLRKGSSAILARDLGISGEALLGYADGRVSLPTSVLKALTLDLFHGSAAYDDAADRLVPVNTEVKSIGVPPPPFDPTADADPYPPRQVPRPGPPPMFPACKTTLPKKSRPGWL
jgi:hypothetical protein